MNRTDVDLVPVYDARTARTLDFTVDLPNIDTILPRFHSEIPRGSLIVVGHMLTKYWSTKNKGWTLGCNLHWVIVLGIPKKKAT
jgi:hypothetical protein